MDYQEALDYLLAQADLERSLTREQSDEAFQLARMHSLLDRLGRPESGRLTIHVAGSKGKGSTAAMIAAILTAAGYRTGMYSSPHLHSFTERIAVDGEPIPEADFAGVIERVIRPAALAEAAESGHGRVTTFEHLTAAALVYFRERGCDAQVIEVGLGGRLDATNAMAAKDLCVVTPISLEHTDILGPTVVHIAREKAGIFRPGVPSVVAPQRYPEALAELRRLAAAGPVVEVATAFAWERRSAGPDGQAATVTGGGLSLALTIPLLGTHQVENAATAVAAAATLAEHGAHITQAAIERGIAAVRWAGRLEAVEREPLIVLDGAHNGDSAARLAESLRLYFTFDRLVLVVAAGRDKDLAAIAAELAPIADTVIATRSSHPRAADPDQVAAAFERYPCSVRVEPDMHAALERARSLTTTSDMICVMGSLFAVADARGDLVGLERAPAL